MRLETIPGRAFHCGQIARRLRTEHAQAVAILGISAHHEIRARFDDSSFCRALLIDGELAGLGGVTGSLMASVGCVWLALTAQALRYPVAIAREAQRQIDEIMRTKHELVTFLVDGDRSSRRFAVALGFRPVGEHWLELTGASRKAVERQMEHMPEARVPFGSGHAVLVGLSRGM